MSQGNVDELQLLFFRTANPDKEIGNGFNLGITFYTVKLNVKSTFFFLEFPIWNHFNEYP